MSARKLDIKRLQNVSARLGDAALDPTLWPEIMEEICRAVVSWLRLSEQRPAEVKWIPAGLC
ncbi:hypothetical protein MHY1_p00008 (plasmid) [Methylovirgula sp. HY1]|nr:hypothetical protein MHY1_p00008 [Methylovirgula sp. HY1]